MKSRIKGGQDAWDPTRYLNVWICNMEYPNAFNVVYGFGTPPTGAPHWEQFQNVTRNISDSTSGVVLHYSIVGRNNPLAPSKYKEGNTATHEIGHYLGLRHIWGDAAYVSQGCNVDDGIFDTPNAKDKHFSCANPSNTCINAINDKPDMTENYMDYALDGCAAMFTKEQAFVMRYVLNRFRTHLALRKINYDTLLDFPETKISIWPNPLMGGSTATILVNNNNDNLIFNVSLIDNSGKEIFTRNIRSNNLSYINVEFLNSSIYFVLITDDSGKFIKSEKILILP